MKRWLGIRQYLFSPEAPGAPPTALIVEIIVRDPKEPARSAVVAQLYGQEIAPLRALLQAVEAAHPELVGDDAAAKAAVGTHVYEVRVDSDPGKAELN